MTLKVLTIDDDAAMTELIALLLRSYGLEVISANEGENSFCSVSDTDSLGVGTVECLIAIGCKWDTQTVQI